MFTRRTGALYTLISKVNCLDVPEDLQELLILKVSPLYAVVCVVLPFLVWFS